MRTILLCKIILICNIVNQVMPISSDLPIRSGPEFQYFILSINSRINLTCPFEKAVFFRWSNLSDLERIYTSDKVLDLKFDSRIHTSVMNCAAISGYGQYKSYFYLKIIDQNSYRFDLDCKRKAEGPCFMVSATSNYFVYQVEEGNEIAFDCRAMMHSKPEAMSMDVSLKPKSSIIYKWRQIHSEDMYKVKLRYTNSPFAHQNGLLSNNNNKISNSQMLDFVKPLKKVESTKIDQISNWSSIVLFSKVTQSMAGYYECSVTLKSDENADEASDIIDGSRHISRLFQLKVTTSKSGRVISGPAVENITVIEGESRNLTCEVFGSLIKPKWGKKLESSADDSEPNTIIRWDNSDIRILVGSLDRQRVDDKKESSFTNLRKHFTNQLEMSNIKASQAGTYICAALSKSSKPEHKYIHLFVNPGVFGATKVAPSSDISNTHNRNFPIYIAVPTIVFVLCLASVIYCCIHRHRSRQKAAYKNRRYANVNTGTTTINTANLSSHSSQVPSQPQSQYNHHHQQQQQHSQYPPLGGTITTNTITSTNNINNSGCSANGSCNGGNSNNSSSTTTRGTGVMFMPLSSNPGNNNAIITSTSNISGPHNQIHYPPTSAPATVSSGGGANLNAHLQYPPSTLAPQPTPYDSDSTPSPPPPTSVTADTISSTTTNNMYHMQPHYPPQIYHYSSHMLQHQPPPPPTTTTSSHNSSSISNNSSSLPHSSNQSYHSHPHSHHGVLFST